MSTAKQPTYGVFAEVLAPLPLLVREHRRYRRLSLRAAADEMGVGFNTIRRLEGGDDCAISTAIAALKWLNGDGERR